MSEGLGVVYGIRHVADRRICYVGQTRRDPRLRWAEHASGRTAISEAFKMLGSGPDVWEFRVLERVPLADLDDRERHWIETLGTLYPQGLNHKAGGSNGRVSAKTKARISAALFERFSSPEFREWRAETSKAIWADDALRANLHAGIVRAWGSPERRQKHRDSMKACMADPDRRARISASMKAFRARKRAEHACPTSA